MFRKVFLGLLLGAVLCPAYGAEPYVTNFRFGIVKPISEGVFEFVAETTCIPRRLKDTGFRFGVGFDNPRGEAIEWYEIVHLPSDLQQLSGDFQRTSKNTLRTNTLRSDQVSVVDEFWFDQGDPTGTHKLEVFVNDARRYSVEFEVFDYKEARSKSGATPNPAIHRTCAKSRAVR